MIVLDAFAGGRVPADLGTLEFITEVTRVLRNDGVFLANIADGPPLRYARRFVATVRSLLPEVVVTTDAAVARGRRFGNLELAAAASGLPVATLARAAAGGAFPVRFLADDALSEFVGNARPLTDDDPLRSPTPPDFTWRVKLG